EPKLQEEFGTGYALARKPHAGQTLAVAAVQRKAVPDFRSALTRLGVAEIQLPERYAGYGVAKAAHVMEERARTQPLRLTAIDTELAQLGEQHGARLASLNRVALNMQD